MLKPELAALASMKGIANASEMGREELIALLEGKESVNDTLDSLLDTNTDSVSKILNKGEDTMSEQKVNSVFCPDCLKVKKITLEQALAMTAEELKKANLHPLTAEAVKYCKKENLPVSCFSHQKAYKKAAKVEATYQKNKEAGNVCAKCGTGLSDKELEWNKTHHNEWIGQEDMLLCQSCQPGNNKFKSVEEAKASEQSCFSCGGQLSADEKACGYWNHNKYGKDMTDKSLCFAHMPKEVVQLFQGKVVNTTASVPADKVAEDKATYGVDTTARKVLGYCTDCNKEIFSEEIMRRNARLQLIPGFKGITLCYSCLKRDNLLEATEK
jgi:hypothetical protein